MDNFKELSEIRETIFSIITYLKSNVIDPITKEDSLAENESLKENLNILIGEKSNILSVLVKLSGLLIKIVPLEYKLTQELKNSHSNQEKKSLTQEDIDIINRYLNRVKNFNNRDEEIDIKKEPDLFD